MVASAELGAITGPDGQPTESIAYNEDLLSWMGASGHDDYARFFPVILATLIALIVSGSAFVIYNAFAISIGERKKQFGMFASVGATSAQIRRIVATAHRPVVIPPAFPLPRHPASSCRSADRGPPGPSATNAIRRMVKRSLQASNHPVASCRYRSSHFHTCRRCDSPCTDRKSETGCCL